MYAVFLADLFRAFGFQTHRHGNDGTMQCSNRKLRTITQQQSLLR